MLEVKVTNNHDRLVGRVNHAFAPGENDPVKVPASRIGELTGCKYFDVVVVGADNKAEIPSGVAVAYDATDEAVELARKTGVDISALEGSGKDGKVLVSDVKSAAATSDGGRKPGDPVIGLASTDDPDPDQAEAELVAAETIGSPETPDDDALDESSGGFADEARDIETEEAT